MLWANPMKNTSATDGLIFCDQISHESAERLRISSHFKAHEFLYRHSLNCGILRDQEVKFASMRAEMVHPLRSDRMAKRSKKRNIPNAVTPLAPASRLSLHEVISRMPFSVGWAALLLAAATFFAYWPSLGSGFVYDARIEIFQEGFITSLSNLPAVLSLKVLGMNLMLSDRPGQLLYLMLTAALWGKDPWGYHLGSNLLHAANVALLFVVLMRLIEPDLTALARNDLWKVRLAAAVATLIFALHPIATEPVAAISYSSDLLVTFFTLLALLAAIAFRPGQFRTAIITGAFGALCAFAAVACKESGMATPLILSVYWFLFRRHEAKGPWGLFLGSATALAAAFLAARFLLAPPPSSSHTLSYLGGSSSQVLLIQPRLWVFMMGKLIWPVPLSADYRPEDYSHLGTGFAWAMLCLIILLQAWLATKSRTGTMGIAIFWLGLATVSNFVPLFRPLADRFYYLPMVGVAMQILALLLLALRSRWGFWLGTAFLFAALLPLTLLTLTREAVFANDIHLWRDTIQVSPFSFIAHNNLGKALLDEGQLDEAIPEFQKALEINSDDDNTHNNLGKALVEVGQADEAMAEFQKAVAINPDDANAHINLGLAQEARGNLNDALLNFRRFVELAPYAPNADYAHLWIWLIRARQNQKAEADQELEACLRKHWNASPKDWVSKNASFLLNDIDENTYLGEAASTDPEKNQNQYCEAWYYAGMKRLLANDRPTAIDYFRKCLATQKIDFDEYQLAQAELRAISASD